MYFENSYFNYTVNPKYFWCYENVSGNLRLFYDHYYEWANLTRKEALL